MSTNPHSIATDGNQFAAPIDVTAAGKCISFLWRNCAVGVRLLRQNVKLAILAQNYAGDIDLPRFDTQPVTAVNDPLAGHRESR